MEKLKLYYREPAKDSHEGWENEALPIGNGSQGAVVFGGVGEEHIQFNEKSLWTGGPSPKRPEYYGGNKKGKYEALAQIRSLLSRGKDEEAEALLFELEGEKEGYGAYQSFGDLFLSFVHEGEITNYERELCLDDATVRVKYRCGDARMERTYFASFPDRVLVGRYFFTGGKLSGRIRLVSAQGGRTEVVDRERNVIGFRGRLEDNDLLYETLLGIRLEGGSLQYEDGEVVFEGGTELVFYLASGTDYINEYPSYRGEDPHKRLADSIFSAMGMDFEALYLRHKKDYQALFHRVSLKFCSKAYDGRDTTEELLHRYRTGGDPVAERYLEVLLFQYGRYLTIAASRKEEGALPSNLQGVWNDSNVPMWGSDYHLNINLQMNYWPTCQTNLSECIFPLIDYVESLRVPGRITAKEYMGIESTKERPENGFVTNTQNTIFGFTCPGWDFYWGWSPAATPWIIQNIWEYYDFTRDIDLLRERIYPIMKEAAIFYEQYLIYDEASGRLVSSPSFSPEHGPVSVGNTYEQTLVWQLFSDTIEAAVLLSEDREKIERWRRIKEQLKPYHIGEDGQLKEWFEEKGLGSVKNYRKEHRHISHLLGLYPGDMIGTEDRELMEAAKVSLLDRGEENTGWSMGHKINAWARTGDGEYAYRLLRKMIGTCILNNLWDTHPPFQIDGNYGLTAGMAEILIKSNQGKITLLPALPKIWKDGKLSGILARGGFELTFDWREGRPQTVEILSKVGADCRIEISKEEKIDLTEENGEAVPFSRENDTMQFKTMPGKRYVLRFLFS